MGGRSCGDDGQRAMENVLDLAVEATALAASLAGKPGQDVQSSRDALVAQVGDSISRASAAAKRHVRLALEAVAAQVAAERQEARRLRNELAESHQSRACNASLVSEPDLAVDGTPAPLSGEVGRQRPNPETLARLRRLEAENRRLREARDALLREATASAGKTADEVALLRDSVADKDAALRASQAECTDLRRQLEDAHVAAQHLEQEVEELRGLQRGKPGHVRARQHQAERRAEEAVQEAQALRARAEKAEARCAALREELADAKHNPSRHAPRVRSLEQQASRLQSQVAALSQERQRLQDGLRVAERERDAAQARQRAAEARLQDAQRSVEEMRRAEKELMEVAAGEPAGEGREPRDGVSEGGGALTATATATASTGGNGAEARGGTGGAAGGGGGRGVSKRGRALLMQRRRARLRSEQTQGYVAALRSRMAATAGENAEMKRRMRTMLASEHVHRMRAEDARRRAAWYESQLCASRVSPRVSHQREDAGPGPDGAWDGAQSAGGGGGGDFESLRAENESLRAQVRIQQRLLDLGQSRHSAHAGPTEAEPAHGGAAHGAPSQTAPASSARTRRRASLAPAPAGAAAVRRELRGARPKGHRGGTSTGRGQQPRGRVSSAGEGPHATSPPPPRRQRPSSARVSLLRHRSLQHGESAPALRKGAL